ncbi:alpha/beta-hydrolase [Peniophora sp. CONT]|nr:alpha/beta-hydrolase [Peniophora sp. CONT]
MGQHKETYEPMLRYLLEKAKYSSYHIDEIWSIDLAQHGDSGMLNASNMGSIYDHMDSVRDIANFLLHFLPEDGAGRLPTHLKRVSPDVTRRREEPLVAYHYPGIFSGMFLVDPVIYAPDADKTKRRTAYIKNSLSRRDRWPSREEAYETLKKTAWGAWDDAVLRVYVQSALADSDEQRGGVTLKCPSFLQEAALHENMTSREAWMAIPLLDPTLPMHWILPTQEERYALHFVPESLVEGPWRRPANAASSCSIIAGGGHLIVQTKPREVAGELHKFLSALSSIGQRARL